MSVYVCFSLKASLIDKKSTDVLEKEYQSVFKPILKCMLSHPNLRISFSFTGIQMEYYRRKHSEMFEILHELIQRKQAEVLGGGYYDPVFPLLFPQDRTGQIDLLSSSIRETTGKRPRGLSLCASGWDSGMLPSLSSCGMEYVLLDESLIPPEKNKSIPLIMSDKGKSIIILPVFTSIKNSCFESAFSFIEQADIFVKKGMKNLPSQELASVCTSGITLQFSTDEFKTLLERKFFEEISDIVSAEESEYKTGTCFQFVKASFYKEPVYIAAGLSKEISQWAVKPYQAVKNLKNSLTIFDFFELYPQSRALYDKMLYVSLLVSQSHGDKARKKNSREQLWEAQNGNGFICTSKGAFVNSSFRQNAYRILTDVEKTLRSCSEFTPSVSSFDYNSDGLNEYVCRMDNYFSEISLLGGAVRELCPLQSSGNYADSLSRSIEFEGVSDGYDRGLFVDHLFTEEELSYYLDNLPSGNGIFSKLYYSEVKFNASRKEISLEVSALYRKKQKVTLRKKYVLTASGMMIQYILKNESDSKLSAKFAVESSFAQTNFQNTDFSAYKLEIILDGEKREVDTKSSSKELNSRGTLNNVQAYYLTDTDNEISFMFEPNEEADLSFVPIIFNRPEYMTGELMSAGMTFANTMIWNVELEAGMEMEKTINFSIYSQHKKRTRVKR